MPPDNGGYCTHSAIRALCVRVDYIRLTGGARSDATQESTEATLSVSSIALSDKKPSYLHRATPTTAANAVNIDKKEMT